MSVAGSQTYEVLLRRRDAYFRQVTRLETAVDAFDSDLHTVHVLRNARESLEACVRSYQQVFEDLLESDGADGEELVDHADKFRATQSNVSATIEIKMEEIRKEKVVDNMPSLISDLAAIKLTFQEFKSFADDCSNDRVIPSEARVRLKDLEAVNQQYLTTWKQIYAKETEMRKKEMEEERKIFSNEFYATLAWFHGKLPSRSSSQPPPNATPAAKPIVKLPKIELPTYNGDPESWIPFHDTFKAIVHNLTSLSGAVKFRYLKTSIVDKNSPIRHLLETDEGYDDAWNAVLEFYDDKRRILDSHFNSMLIVKPMEVETHEELQRVLNDYSLHLTSLERMHSQEELYQAMVAHLVLQRLDPHTRDLWETKNNGKTPLWPALQEFLKHRRKTLSSMPAPKSSQPKLFSKPNQKSSHVHAATKSPAVQNHSGSQATEPLKRQFKCHMCGTIEHRLHACPQFLNLPIPNRLAKITEWKLCTNCFGSHSLSECRFKFRCRACKQRHHNLLHLEQAPRETRGAAHSAQAAQISLQAAARPFSFTPSSCNTASGNRSRITLLQTAMVQVKGRGNQMHCVRAFLDSGSDSNFITTSAAKALNLPLERTYVEANGIGGDRAMVIKHKVCASIGNSTDSFSMELLVTPKITNPTPSVNVTATNLEIPPNLPLADPTFDVPGRIDILIGNEFYGELMRDGRIKLTSGPTLLNTVFGWILSGSVSQASPAAGNPRTHHITTNCHHTSLAEIRESVEKFYNLEDYRTPKRFLTEVERNCEQNFEQTHQRGSDGRFIVTILYNGKLALLKNNFRNALSQFLSSEKRWQKNEPLRTRIIAFMREYEDLNHMTPVDIKEEPLDSPAFYLPYHAVENLDSTTTKLRVVFNGSARTLSGISLNDTQCVGPQVQCDMFTLSLRFRVHPIVIKGDIEKMYRQIEVAPHQRRFQRIIFRENPEDKLKVYELNTVTYGTAAASYEATRCLQELGIVNRDNFPEAAEAIIDNTYVDDVLTGAKNVEEAKKLAGDIVSILRSAGMKLRKFASNSGEFLESIPENLHDSISSDGTIKTLGLKWNPKEDSIGFVTRPVQFEKVTRRIILSEIASNFDPDGLLGPVTFSFKKFLKVVFSFQLPWDAQISAKEASEWKEIASTFQEIDKIRIPRHAIIENFIDVQLHGFCDASDAGYGACVYTVSTNAEGRTLCRILCAKSRIAPKEYRSTARLELCAAVVLVHLMNQVTEALNLPFSKKVCWSDSAIVLYWLKKCPSLLLIFVANRVSEIQEISKLLELTWRHIRGELNPADLISRGLTPAEIEHCSIWWNGPEFLTAPETQWPESIVQVDPNEPLFAQEFRRVETWAHATSTNELPDENPFLEMIANSSRTFSIKWKLAPFMRFIFNARARKLNVARRTGPFQVDDLLDAENSLARISQIEAFPDEFLKCSNGFCVPSKSKLKNLDPVWDANIKLLRVGGRLNRAERCDDRQKHPIILPNCHFARLIIRETHQQNLHAGQNATHSFVRLRYWPIRAKHIVRQEVHKCIKCFRARPKLTEQMMGQLPPERVTPSPTFFHTGVDYCGPFDIKVSKVRSATTMKSYVALFVCLSTKAVHLELVTDLDTAAFFSAFDKFVSRRGLPHTMTSDNGLNFVGAANDLTKIHEFLAKEHVQAEIQNYLAKQEIRWKFIPPRAPSQGGLWEAAVKSMKHHLHRVASTALLTFEEFDRLIVKIEAIMNSRPLTAISNDPSDLSALTAGHFLIGRPLIAKPDRNWGRYCIKRLVRWDRVIHIQQDFWNRWSRDYLHQLQVRTKNYKDIVPVKVGQLVLLHVDNSPSMHWPLGRIIDIFPGDDKVTRVAKIQTATKTLDRPLDKLALLPIDPDEDQPEVAEDVRANINVE